MHERSKRDGDVAPKELSGSENGFRGSSCRWRLLRIAGDLGQNLQHNVNSGGVTIDDSTLIYTPLPPSHVVTLGTTASAYTIFFGSLNARSILCCSLPDLATPVISPIFLEKGCENVSDDERRVSPRVNHSAHTNMTTQ